MKKYIMFIFMGLILTACEFKTNVVLPEKDKNEIEINVIKEKIEMAEKEIKLLMEINAGMDDGNGKTFNAKIFSKVEAKFSIEFCNKEPDICNKDMEMMRYVEIAENSKRIYALMSRIKEWNEKLNQLY